ncbi:MAG TPA: crotonase/enoyl-CoA hydratase family protein [Chitinophagaceae bacterium]|nr:crotonase/enoyl-CoA hydratase family protein [Chitinophagaceae bacterium]
MFINNNLRIKIDEEHKILWVGIDLQDKLCYSINFLDNLSHVKDLMIYMIKKENIKYVVAYSLNKGVWNLGGDLEFFVSCIRNHNRQALQDYAYKCVDLVYNFNSNYDLDIFSTCVVQGNAFGGGFESALSGNYIIAEQSAKFSFPEVIFGTFPGMGAYSFLTKKVGFNRASEIINSNKTFTAQEIFDQGIINKVCDDGHGLATVSSMIKNGEMDKIVSNPFSNICNKVSKQELIDIVNVWLDRAFVLNEDNLARMTKLANFQKRKIEQTKELEPKIEEEQKISQINSLINNSFQPSSNS